MATSVPSLQHTQRLLNARRCESAARSSTRADSACHHLEKREAASMCDHQLRSFEVLDAVTRSLGSHVEIQVGLQRRTTYTGSAILDGTLLDGTQTVLKFSKGAGGARREWDGI